MESIIETIYKDQYGFVCRDQIAKIVDENRFIPILIRCGGCRMTVAAQYVENVIGIIGIIERDGQDYIRDLSLMS